MRLRPTYANVVATLALVIAVGGAGGHDAIAAAVKKLAPNSVATKNIRKGAVTGVKIKDHTITSADVARSALGGNEIKNGSLGGADIADGSLGGQDIAAGSLGGYNLARGTIGSREIADGSISSDDISDHTISDHDLAPGAITSDNLGPATIKGTNIAPQTITQGNLDPAAIDYLTHSWDASPIAVGSTLVGYGAIAYNAAIDSEDHPETRALSVSFPAPVTGITDVKAGGSPECTGSFLAPTSTSGVACFYIRTDPGHGDNVGTATLLDFSSFGFALGYHPPAAGWTFAQISWAYTRP